MAKARRKAQPGAIAGTKASEVGADGEKIFSRRQAATYLNVGHTTLRWWHSLGRLVPALNRNGVHLYTREQLEQWQRGNPDAVSARAFALFEGGATAVQVVIELHADPETVEKLQAIYTRLSGSWLIQGPSGPRYAWERAYAIGKLTPEKLRKALELCSADESLRAKLIG